MTTEVSETVREGVTIVSADWRYLYVDETAAQLCHRERADLVGRPLSEGCPHLESSPLFEAMRRCMKERSSATLVQHASDDTGATTELTLRIEPCLEGLILRVTKAVPRHEPAVTHAPARDSAWAAELTEGAQPVVLLEDRRTRGTALGELLRQVAFQPEMIAFEPQAMLSMLAARLPRIAVIDLSHQRRDRLWVISSLGRRFPLLRIVAIAPGATEQLAASITRLGAARVLTTVGAEGWVLRRTLAELLSERASRPSKRPRPPPPPVNMLSTLTPREREVLAHIANGSDNLKVAALLGISERTVKTHVTSIFRKVGAENRVELALAARGLA